MDTRSRICLIAEDEVFIGMDLEETIAAAGFEVRWFASMERALASIDEIGLPDAAVIDIHLREGLPCTELARRLKQHAVPFIIYRGRSIEDRPED